MRPAGAQRLRDRRQELGWSLERLAKEVGVSKESVRLWETGRSLRDRHLMRLAEVLRLSPGELIAGERGFASLEGAEQNVVALLEMAEALERDAIMLQCRLKELLYRLKTIG